MFQHNHLTVIAVNASGVKFELGKFLATDDLYQTACDDARNLANAKRNDFRSGVKVEVIDGDTLTAIYTTSGAKGW